jgi:hypothetical protein
MAAVEGDLAVEESKGRPPKRGPGWGGRSLSHSLPRSAPVSFATGDHEHTGADFSPPPANAVPLSCGSRALPACPERSRGGDPPTRIPLPRRPVASPARAISLPEAPTPILEFVRSVRTTPRARFSTPSPPLPSPRPLRVPDAECRTYGVSSRSFSRGYAWVLPRPPPLTLSSCLPPRPFRSTLHSPPSTLHSPRPFRSTLHSPPSTAVARRAGRGGAEQERASCPFPVEVPS